VWINLAFSVRLAERYRAVEAKTSKDPTIQKAQLNQPSSSRCSVSRSRNCQLVRSGFSKIKLDGYRCIAVKQGKDIALFPRHKKVLNRRFPGVVDALASLKGDFDLDGEVVVLDLEGRPSFQLLHGAVSASLPTHFYAFDVLDKNGELLGISPFAAPSSAGKPPGQRT
jgi:hypothetical protein